MRAMIIFNSDTIRMSRDPDLLLTHIREAIAHLEELTRESDCGWIDTDDPNLQRMNAADAAIEAFESLDRLLSSGGTLPSAWRMNEK
jgi:hypothetical protein